MEYVLIVIVGYLGYQFYQKVSTGEFNFKRACLFAVIGAFLGTSLGVAGFGGAMAGWSIFGAIGFYIGGQETKHNSNKS